ncbi:hypothetical protein M0R89_18500 (plasmid) [Halorussus limi]|uniref:C2H2-type domain-containing protein n=1 Tax=Halorussus limi TaxID=2938695 RepID=A0A8U0I188_9EURY|nr:hypothetical protein [Halorussus limi]UPV76524.1 hypothetical protein M0R89_18500 [Halorussus limi]
MTATVPESDVRVPDGETPVRCPHCQRPFRTERLRALHVGDFHGGDCTDGQREAYDDALEAEREDLFVYHLKVVAGLVAVYAFFFLTYLAVSMMQVPG